MNVRGSQNTVIEISSVRQAAEYLILHWPDDAIGRWKHLEAQVACLDVLEGKQDSQYARQAFEDAAREAGILVTET